MNWLMGLIIGAGVLAVGRIYWSLQKARHAHRGVDFDEQLIARLRADGLDPFSAHKIDFFVAFPDEASAARVLGELRGKGMIAELQQTADAADFPVSVHVSREMHLTVESVKSIGRELGQLAQTHGGRYDGWALGKS